MTDNALEKAFELQQKKKLKGAKRLFKQMLEKAPQNPDALHGLGICYAQNGEYQKALSCLQKAVTLSPQTPGFHNNLGNVYKALNNFHKAQTHYQEALRLKSPYPDALNNLGSLYYQQGQIEQAIPLLQKALRENPDFIDAHYNLANCFASQNRLSDAIPHYKKVLNVCPDDLVTMHNLAISLTKSQDFVNAKPLLETLFEQEPDNYNAAFHLGIVENAIGDLKRAKALYKTTLRLVPDHEPAHHNLAALFLQEQNRDKALKHFKAARKLNPENQTAKHMIAALTGQEAPEGAPLEFVRDLFNQYAYTYEQHVKTQLDYQVPNLLRQILAPFTSKITHPWEVLDLGCGTGLSLPYFNDIAGKITGVDISPAMIEVARQKGGYYALHAQDIDSFFQKQTNQYDLILAADVLVYLGQLQTLFAQCYKALNSPGFFVFSIESLKEGSQQFALTETGRYAHHPNYIQQLAKDNHFTLKAQKSVSLRRQEGMAVAGELFVLTKNTPQKAST